MPFLIACRLAAYGRYAARAWMHLPELGIRHLELPMPAPAEWAALRDRFDATGLSASSLQAACDLRSSDALEIMKPQIEACAALGAKICMLVTRAEGAERARVWDRLRAIGDAAQDAGVTIALETHPDLVTSGQVGRDTMQAVGHANVRINYDTANVYFYNEGVTATGELEKVLPYVAAVHLKDTTGTVGDWEYPPLGCGIVDFPGVFGMLNAQGFTGPFTLELEGSRSPERSEAEQLRYVADAVQYLRRIGVFDQAEDSTE